MKIVTGVFQVGKHPDSNEDAYFICERGFGVADGVSGWNDYGFSSSLFSNQLMNNCRDEILAYIEDAKTAHKSKKAFDKIKKNSSFLSMENLDLNED